ncbi:hypothetical protein ACFW9X_28055 [Streptomyces sp. NPDC059466]|uniref:hypothetical protein n=1 Tax=Streptomyces sp. NPDC059466 TaxID=3346843 RepID=UPI0036CC61AF
MSFVGDRARAAVRAAAVALLLVPVTGTAAVSVAATGSAASTGSAFAVSAVSAVSAAGNPAVRLSASEAGTGGSVTVTGSGWRPRTLLMMMICGRSVPSRGVIGGTNSCANAGGRAVTTDAEGDFEKRLPVTEPPAPCPCVVHVATDTGGQAAADAVFMVAGHPVAPLPKESGGGRLSVLTDTRLDGSGGVLTWFGAPPARDLVFTVGNVGTASVKDPVFQVGTSHGVFAPQWEEQQWRGTVAPGRKALITLPVELAAGAHGDYTVSLRYGGKVLAEQPWGVGRPWGVTLFWILLCVVVPAAVFRIGMAVVDRARPRRSARRAGRHRGLRLAGLTLGLPWRGGSPAPSSPPPAPGSAPEPAKSAAAGGPVPKTATTPALPWFTPDSDPGGTANGQLSAPQENSPTTKGNT